MRRKPSLRVLVGTVAFGAALTSGALAAQGAVRKAPTPAQLVKRVPAQLRPQYVHALDPLMPSAYDNFKPVKGPWKICFSDSYEGNPWRVRVLHDLQLMNKQFAKAGLTDKTLLVEVSNNSVPNQITQIRSMIDKGCSAIVSFLGSTKGFDPVIKEAFDKGIPFVAAAGSPTSPYSINANANWYVFGANAAKAIVKELHGKGNVVMVDGIAGAPVAVGENAGAKSVFEKYPGIHVLAEVNGNWTPSVAKTQMLNVLATHPQSIDAVWSTGGAFEAIGQAFQQAHRSLPKMITGAGSGYGLGWWHQNAKNMKGWAAAVEPDVQAQEMYRIAIRLLEGQHPVINTILEPLGTVTSASLNKWWRPCMTPDSTSAFPVPPNDPLPEALLNKYFKNGKATSPYNYKKASLPPC